MTEPSSSGPMPEDFQPNAVVDIVSYGFRCLFRHVKNLALIALPVFALMGAGQLAELLGRSALFPAFSKAILWVGGNMLQLTLSVWVFYAALRYITQVFAGVPIDKPWSCFNLNPAFMGYLGINLLTLLAITLEAAAFGVMWLAGTWLTGWIVVLGNAFGPTGLVGVILISLAIIALAACVMIYTKAWSDLALVRWIAHPEIGVFKAIMEVGGLLRDNRLRTLGLCLLVVLIYALMMSPVLFLKWSLSMVQNYNPLFLREIWFILLYPLLSAVAGLFGFLLGYCASVFVSCAYLQDLRIRARLKTTVLEPSEAVL